MRSAILLLLCFAHVTCGTTDPAHSIGETPACGECRIIIEPVVALGDIADPDSPWQEFTFVRNSRGRVIVASLTDRATLGVYGPTGELESTIGRSGAGPGEYSWARWIFGAAADTLLVFDIMLSRYTVLSPDFEVVRTIQLPLATLDIVPFASNDFIATVPIDAPETQAEPFHRVLDGEIVRSFGEAPQRRDRDRAVQRAGNGTFWAARRNQYLIERWDTSGTLLQTITAEPEWFPHWQDQPRDEPPFPWIDAIWPDDDGLLWVLMRVATSHPEPIDEAELLRASPYLWSDARLDSRIDVIDPETGELVATHRSDRLLDAPVMSTPGLVSVREQEPSGWVRTTILRLRLERG